MSQFPINNSFSFYKKYYAAHEFSSEYPASQNPMQSNQKIEDSKNTSIKKSNNQETDSLNLSGQSSIHNESNSKINELIKINKLLSLVIFISNESNEI